MRFYLFIQPSPSSFPPLTAESRFTTENLRPILQWLAEDVYLWDRTEVFGCLRTWRRGYCEILQLQIAKKWNIQAESQDCNESKLKKGLYINSLQNKWMRQNPFSSAATSLRAWQETLVIKTATYWFPHAKWHVSGCRDVVIRVIPALRHCRLISIHRLHEHTV